MTVGELISAYWTETATFSDLGRLLRVHGVDLCGPDLGGTIQRGTPVYVDTRADPLEVQHRMAAAHARMVFVLQGDRVVGVIDLVELVAKAESLDWLEAEEATG